jgi:aspartyl-tRNA(Asn)/glutamyl-tRNA(Gln) amidotransferase subunit C
MLTDKEIQHIADLARIKITPQEGERLKKDLSSILDYIDQLNKIDTAGVEPLYQTTGLVNSVRPDEPRGEFVMDDKLNERLLGQAPHKENRFIKVKAVLAHK